MHTGENIISDYKFLPMENNDLEEVLKIENLSFPQPWTRALFEREFKNPVSHPYVEKVVYKGVETLGGYIVLWIVREEGYILNIAVKPELRRTGLGRRLLLFSLGFMKEQGVKDVYLEVRKTNDAARKLYHEFGFDRVFVRENYYADGEDAIVMRLSLR